MKQKIVKSSMTFLKILGLLVYLFLSESDCYAQLKVKGRFLFDQNGEKVILRGVNEMFIYSKDRTGAVTYPEIAKTGANSCRILWLIDENVPKSDLEANVKNAINNGIIPIVGLWNSTGKWDANLTSCIDWWCSNDVVSVCNNNPFMIVNIANEAGKDAMTDYTTVYSDAVKKLRKAGITNVIMIDADRWGRNWQTLDTKAVQILEADPDRNIMFSWHIWDVNIDCTGPINTMTDKGFCLIIGEFSYKSVGCECCINYQKILETCQLKEIGWLPWSWGLRKNGDCKSGDMDMTTDGTFAGLKPGWATDVCITDLNSIKNTAIRPKSILKAKNNTK